MSDGGGPVGGSAAFGDEHGVGEIGRIIEVGWATSFQDRGRPGHGAIGVPSAGAVDLEAAARVNRLVGNPLEAPVIETRGACVIETTAPATIATSADGARRTLQPGATVRVDPPTDGLWGYLAVRGGFVTELVLGSASHDSLSGLGPPRLAPGDTLRAGRDPGTEMPADLAPPSRRGDTARVWPGPRSSWFAGGLGALVDVAWVVSNDVSRVGTRLRAGTFDPLRPFATMASEGIVTGAVQVTPSGEPIVMLADHPTTGGYPVIAVVEPADLGVVAQAPPGSTIRFTRVS